MSLYRTINYQLYLVTNTHHIDDPQFESHLNALLEGGVSLVQMRDKHPDTRVLIERAKRIQRICRAHQVPLIINDRIDVCMAIDAAGVHLGQSDIDIKTAKAILGPHKIIGATTKTVEDAIAAEQAGAHYLGVGAIYPTTTKLDAPITAVQTLKQITNQVSIPVVAIGGLSKDRLSILEGSNIAGVSICSALMDSPSPQEEAAATRIAIDHLLNSTKPSTDSTTATLNHIQEMIHNNHIDCYDLVVIGSGSGNIVVDAALKAGKRVALIEKNLWGGTCLNRGCIPSKILLSPADILEASEQYTRIGIEHADLSPNWSTIRTRMIDKVHALRTDVQAYYQAQSNCTLIEGKATFSNRNENFDYAKLPFDAPKFLEIEHEQDTKIIAAKQVVIAVGGHSRIVKIDGMQADDYWSSEDFFHHALPKKLPKRITIIGGADIGVEFAHFFNRMGTSVTLIQHNVRLVPKQDKAISDHLKAAFDHQGIHVYLNQDTVRVERCGSVKRLYFKDRETGKEQYTETDMLFISAGIVSDALDLNTQAIGLELDQKGWIPTNEFLQTSIPGIYAIGDVNGNIQLRHKANYEADILGWNLYTKAQKPARFARYDAVPSATFTSPQIGRVGYSEDEAKKAGYDVKIAKQTFSQVIKSYALGIEPDMIQDGFVKLVIDRDTDRILGAHIIGHEAAILVQGLAWLIQSGKQPHRPVHPEIEHSDSRIWRTGLDLMDEIKPNYLESLIQTMTIHPALSEVVGWAPQHIED